MRDSRVKDLEHKLDAQTRLNSRQAALILKTNSMQDEFKEYKVVMAPFMADLKKYCKDAFSTGARDAEMLRKQVCELEKRLESATHAANKDLLAAAIELDARLVAGRDPKCDGCAVLTKKLDETTFQLHRVERQLVSMTALARVKTADNVSRMSEYQKMQAMRDGLCVCKSGSEFKQQEMARMSAALDRQEDRGRKMIRRMECLERMLTKAKGSMTVEAYALSLGLEGDNSVVCYECADTRKWANEAVANVALLSKKLVAVEAQCLNFEEKWKHVTYELSGMKAEIVGK
jgi:hypothetical protein